MSFILYITAHPFEVGTYSLTIGTEFIETYRELNPNDEITHWDLYRANIPQIDADLLQHWGQPPSGPSFEELSADAQAKILLEKI